MSVIVDVVINTDQAEQQLQALQQEIAQGLAQNAASIGTSAGQAATATARAAGKNATEEFLRAFDPDKLRSELEGAGLGEQEIQIILDTTEAKAETQKLKDSIAGALAEASGLAEDQLKQITAQVAREVDRAAGKVKSVTEIVDGVRDLKTEMKSVAGAGDAAAEGVNKLFDIEKTEQYVQALGDVFDVVTKINEHFGFLTEKQSKVIEDLGSIMTAGAGAGAIFGPWGAAIGAAGAALLQVASQLYDLNTTSKKEEQERLAAAANYRKLIVETSFDVAELNASYQDFSEIDLSSLQGDLKGMATEQANLMAQVAALDPQTPILELEAYDKKLLALSDAQGRLIQNGYQAITLNVKKAIEELDQVDAKPKSAETLRQEMAIATAKIQETRTALLNLEKQRSQFIVSQQTSKKGIFSYDYESAANLFDITKQYFALLQQGKDAVAAKKAAEEGLSKASVSGVGAVSQAQQKADNAEKKRIDLRTQATEEYFSKRIALLDKYTNLGIDAEHELEKQSKQSQINILQDTLDRGDKLSKSMKENISDQIAQIKMEMKAADITFPMDKALAQASELLDSLPKELREGFAIQISKAGSAEQINSIAQDIQKAINEQPIFLALDKKNIERQFSELAPDLQEKYRKDLDKILELKVGFDPRGVAAGKEALADLLYEIKKFDIAQKKSLEEQKKAQQEYRKQVEDNIKAIEGSAKVVGAVYMDVTKAIFAGQDASKALVEGIRDAIAQGLLALAKEFGVKAIAQLAEGWAALGLGPLGAPIAAAHFKSAALYTAAAAAAGLGSAAVSSLGNGSTGAPSLNGQAGNGSEAGVGGTSNSLGGRSQQDNSTPTPIVVDLRGAVFPTNDLTGAQQFGEAVARSLAAASAGNQPMARRLIGTRGFVV